PSCTSTRGSSGSTSPATCSRSRSKTCSSRQTSERQPLRRLRMLRFEMNRIADYALIGDCHSAALVGRDGSIDWACFPRFDSPSVFCKLLDEVRGGAFALAPKDVRSSRRAYLEATNVLVTTFPTRTGILELTDCMPVAPLPAGT